MNVIITGASRGIGLSLTKKFSTEKRTKLYIISRNKEKLQLIAKECESMNFSAEIHIIPVDLMKLDSEILTGYIGSDHIDIVINNAGALIKKPFVNLLEKDIMTMVNTNFIAPLRLISLLFSNMGGESSTHIINIGSMGGFQGSVKFPGLSVYSATKAALASLTECLAVELENKNIFINCLALGSVGTEMFQEAFPGHKASVSAEEMAEYIADFALKGHKYHNGKILPVSTSTP